MPFLRHGRGAALTSRGFRSQASRPYFQTAILGQASVSPNDPSLLARNAKTTVEDGRQQPRNVQAIYLKPFRREAEHGVPSCDLQLRSFSVRNVEFYADFALRAAYYLSLPAFGPVPLPRITERWTVPRCHFIHKKSQENFERVTYRRLVQIRDGNPETVQIWLAFLNKHGYYGIGMKANIWEFSKLGVGKGPHSGSVSPELESMWAHMGQARSLGTPDEIEEQLRRKRFMPWGTKTE